MTATAAAPIFNSRDIVAGAAAEGHGAIVGWSGQGTLPRSEIVQALADASLPADWAPAQQSAISDAGRSLREVARGGHVKRVKAQRADKFDARWIVFRADDAAQVGDTAGRVVLAAELHGEELLIVGDAAMAADVRAAYDERRNGQLYAAGDVTAWLRGLLYSRCGATAFGVGYYVPAAGREVAGLLASAVSARWGSAWICPLLPVATSDELRVGIARGLIDDVRGVATSLAAARAAAARENRPEVRPGDAARLLAELGAIHERTAAYRLLCGAAVIAPTVVEIAALRETLVALTDDATVRVRHARPRRAGRGRRSRAGTNPGRARRRCRPGGAPPGRRRARRRPRA
jgi:hypothetical protein